MTKIQDLLKLVSEFPRIGRVDFANDDHRLFINQTLIALKQAAPDIAEFLRFRKFMAEKNAWSLKTFGTIAERGPVGPLKHLAKEAAEAAADPSDFMEYADCLFLILDANLRAGRTFVQLLEGCEQKLEIVKARKYPKATPETANEALEHDRTIPDINLSKAERNNQNREAIVDAVFTPLDGPMPICPECATRHLTSQCPGYAPSNAASPAPETAHNTRTPTAHPNTAGTVSTPDHTPDTSGKPLSFGARMAAARKAGAAAQKKPAVKPARRPQRRSAASAPPAGPSATPESA